MAICLLSGSSTTFERCASANRLSLFDSPFTVFPDYKVHPCISCTSVCFTVFAKKLVYKSHLFARFTQWIFLFYAHWYCEIGVSYNQLVHVHCFTCNSLNVSTCEKCPKHGTVSRGQSSVLQQKSVKRAKWKGSELYWVCIRWVNVSLTCQTLVNQALDHWA